MSKRKEKIIPVNFTSREFATIKADLVNHAKRYYPDTFQDFSEASFGSMMLDTVAYVGDMLSFYLDYQANEAFLDTSVEYENVIRHARRLGYEPFSGQSSASGFITFYITVPANATGGGPDEDYMPRIRKGASLQSKSGVSYTLTEDVDFGADVNEVVVAAANSSTGIPTSYAVRAKGFVISGAYYETTIPIGNYQPYRQVEIIEPSLVEVISVIDGHGNPYFEVDYLSQDVVYMPVKNPSYDGTAGEVQSLLKPFSVPRRFTKQINDGIVTLQFGAGSERELADNLVADPSKVVINQYAKSYISDKSFDPSRLLQTEKLGVGPSDTALRVVYRVNDGPSGALANAQTGTIEKITSSKFSWKDITTLSAGVMGDVIKSIECSNEEPIIGDLPSTSAIDIKLRAKSAHAAQNRAVTREDYVYAIYSMPPEYGKVSRCTIQRDADSLKRNLNAYVICQSPTGHYMKATPAIKSNIKTWLTNKKMINDTIDILDAKIINLGVEYVIIPHEGYNKYDVLKSCQVVLNQYFGLNTPDIGEPFKISTLYKLLNAVPGVTDTVDIEVVQKAGGQYSDIKFDIFSQTTPDKLFVKMPKDVIWEVFDPENDVKGTAK